MTFAWQLTDQDRVLVTDYAGEISGEDLMRAQGERTEAMRAAGGVRYVLNDFSGTRSIDVPMATILDHARVASEKLGEAGNGLRIAFVVPPGLAHGLARVWTAHVNEYGWAVELFQERAQAEDWLRRESGLPLTFGRAAGS